MYGQRIVQQGTRWGNGKKSIKDSDKEDQSAVKYVNDLYKYLMEKHNWTTNQIDEEDFFLLSDLVFGEAVEEEEVMTIDQVRNMYLYG